MFALAINGSPRKDGNTYLMLQEVLKPLQDAGWDANIMHVGNIHGCRACYGCRKQMNQRCVFDKDGFNALFEHMVRADAIILGSPTYYTDVTAEMKALIDRAGFVAGANNRLFQGKIGAAVVVARRGGSIHAFDSMNHMFHISRMILPGSTYWNIGYGRDKGDVLNDTEGLANMNHLGRMINWLGTALQGHKDTLPE